MRQRDVVCAPPHSFDAGAGAAFTLIFRIVTICVDFWFK
ncbi:hypothetical protein BVG79_01136 [Ketogulonicigenium robustum]|uniref:Uncharacterized protein n=1 Tax=Ketogulonicigenium robustum TaxID=92947 RepID=A0A1W6NZ10_9RHOB|nr:hypothetical protein BVG79_01136 [Ketogulonicigenium robustum]